jgi:hypothetical protein
MKEHSQFVEDCPLPRITQVLPKQAKLSAGDYYPYGFVPLTEPRREVIIIMREC